MPETPGELASGIISIGEHHGDHHLRAASRISAAADMGICRARLRRRDPSLPCPRMRPVNTAPGLARELRGGAPEHAGLTIRGRNRAALATIRLCAVEQACRPAC